MLVRILSGIVLLLITGSSLIIGGWYLYGICIFISLVGMIEYYRVLGINKKLPGIIGYVGATAYYVSLLMTDECFGILVLTATAIAMMIAYVATFPKYTIEDIAKGYFGVIYVAVMISYIYLTRKLPDGEYLAWLIFICSWGSDSFAYLAGVAFGKHKMTPKLSPKKSYEGAVGGIAGAAVLGALFGVLVKYLTGADYMAAFTAASAIGATISIFGDLAASAIKRNKDIKDYGRLIPGHGGILDRYDSVIFTAPIVYWVLYFIVR